MACSLTWNLVASRKMSMSVISCPATRYWSMSFFGIKRQAPNEFASISCRRSPRLDASFRKYRLSTNTMFSFSLA